MMRRLVVVLVVVAGAGLLFSSALAAGTVTVTGTGSFSPVGNYLGSNYGSAQSVLPLEGYVTQFTFYLSSVTGTPDDGIHYDLDPYDILSEPGPGGPSHQSGLIESPSVGTNVITVTSPWYVDGTEVVYLTLYTGYQSSGNYYNISRSTTNSYANGHRCYSTDTLLTWTCDSYDMAISVTTVEPTSTPTPTATATGTATNTPQATSVPGTPSATPSCSSSQFENPYLELHLMDWVYSGAELTTLRPHTGTYDVHLPEDAYLEQSVDTTGGDGRLVLRAALRGGIVDIAADFGGCDSYSTSMQMSSAWSVIEVDRRSCGDSDNTFTARFTALAGDVWVDDVFVVCDSPVSVGPQPVSVVSVEPNAYSSADMLIVALLVLAIALSVAISMIVMFRRPA